MDASPIPTIIEVLQAMGAKALSGNNERVNYLICADPSTSVSVNPLDDSAYKYGWADGAYSPRREDVTAMDLIAENRSRLCKSMALWPLSSPQEIAAEIAFESHCLSQYKKSDPQVARYGLSARTANAFSRVGSPAWTIPEMPECELPTGAVVRAARLEPNIAREVSEEDFRSAKDVYVFTSQREAMGYIETLHRRGERLPFGSIVIATGGNLSGKDLASALGPAATVRFAGGDTLKDRLLALDTGLCMAGYGAAFKQRPIALNADIEVSRDGKAIGKGILDVRTAAGEYLDYNLKTYGAESSIGRVAPLSPPKDFKLWIDAAHGSPRAMPSPSMGLSRESVAFACGRYAGNLHTPGKYLETLIGTGAYGLVRDMVIDRSWKGERMVKDYFGVYSAMGRLQLLEPLAYAKGFAQGQKEQQWVREWDQRVGEQGREVEFPNGEASRVQLDHDSLLLKGYYNVAREIDASLSADENIEAYKRQCESEYPELAIPESQGRSRGTMR